MNIQQTNNGDVNFITYSKIVITMRSESFFQIDIKKRRKQLELHPAPMEINENIICGPTDH